MSEDAIVWTEPTTHELKTWPEHFQAIADGSKTFELRRDDRGFAYGDWLLLREYDPTLNEYTGREERAWVMYVLRDAPQFGLMPGYVVLALWMHERRWDAHEDKLTGHDEQLATLAGRIQSLADFLGVDVHDAVDDSPGAMEANLNDAVAVQVSTAEPELADDTDEFPAVPATEPSGIPIQVHGALIERPSPVRRDLSGEFPSPFDSAERKAKRAADIEERLKSFNFIGGRK